MQGKGKKCGGNRSCGNLREVWREQQERRSCGNLREVWREQKLREFKGSGEGTEAAGI
jgi:hypothetical protein